MSQYRKTHPDHDSKGHHWDRAWSRDEALATLEAPDRARYLDPIAFWNRVGVAEGATVVDVGSGTGFFARPAARMVGPRGHVYAVDISRELSVHLSQRSQAEGLRQLEAVTSTARAIPLSSAIADVVLLATVLHDISPSTITEAVRLLRPTGVLVDVDWNASVRTIGPPLEIRLSTEAAADLLARHGLRVVDSWIPGPYHYALKLVRAAPPSPASR